MRAPNNSNGRGLQASDELLSKYLSRRRRKSIGQQTVAAADI